MVAAVVVLRYGSMGAEGMQLQSSHALLAGTPCRNVRSFLLNIFLANELLLSCNTTRTRVYYRRNAV